MGSPRSCARRIDRSTGASGNVIGDALRRYDVKGVGSALRNSLSGSGLGSA
jgi:hypothetical protein